MRIFAATIATETNTFSPLPTSLDSYREAVFFRPGEHPTDAPRMCTAPLFVARRRAKAEGFTLIEGSCFAASPAGTTSRQAYEEMRDEVLKLSPDGIPTPPSPPPPTPPSPSATSSRMRSMSPSPIRRTTGTSCRVAGRR